WICLLGIVIGGGYYAVRVIIPLLLRRVNAVYAALAIEQNLPTLKNSLVNLLLLRNSGSSASAAVLEAVEAQAASRLAQVDTEVHVDRTRLIRLGYVLIGVMALAALYKFVSPKDPLQTFQRVFSPWAAISAPTRVQIARVTPATRKSLPINTSSFRRSSTICEANRSKWFIRRSTSSGGSTSARLRSAKRRPACLKR